MDTVWPMVGRRDEVALIEEVLAGATGGLVLAGVAGVGKTRLLRVAMERARDRGFAVELMAATQAGAAVPLGAASQLLPADAGSTGPRGGAEFDQTGLFRRVADHLGDRSVLLAVDDAHLLDAGSAALLHYLIVHRLVLALVTVRSGEPVLDAVTALWKDGLARRLEVRPLAESEIDELVDQVLGGHVPVSVRAPLRQFAEGNPLHLRALMLDELESGGLRQVNGVWQWHGPVPAAWRLRELVETRLVGCDPAARAVVEVVACGEPVPLGLVECDAGLVAAEQAGMVSVDRDGRRAMVRLAHPLYGEALRRMLGPIRVREICRTLAARLEQTPLRRRDDHLRIATWHLAAGAPPSPSVLLPAAAQAMARYDLVLAERLARAAVDAGANEGRLILAEVLHWRGRHEDGMALLSAITPGDVDPSRWSAWLRTKAQILYWGLARHEEARTILTAPAHEGDATRALILLSDGHGQDALEVGLAIAADESASVDSRLWAYVVAVTASAAIGRIETALSIADDGESLAATQSGEIHIAGPYLLMARFYALLFAGRLTQARQLVERGSRDAVRLGDQGLIAAWCGLRGLVCQVQGDLEVSVAALREAVAIEERHDPSGNLRLHMTVLAGALAMTGAAGEARQVLLRADAVASPVQRLFQPQVETNRAWVHAAGGELTRAADVAISGAAIAREAGMPCLEAMLLHDAARHGGAVRVRGRLQTIAESVESGLVTAFAASAVALAAQDGPALVEVAAVFATLAAPLLAAEAMLAAGRAFRLSGAVAQANIARERARAYRERCPAARTPGLVGDVGAVPLTPREREIAMLAAQSISSAEIARRLRVSVRTVNNHLAHVYQKLDISRRSELAKVFGSAEPLAGEVQPGSRSANS